jgi:hypothetical protein
MAYTTEEQWLRLFALTDQAKIPIMKRVRAIIADRVVSTPEGMDPEDPESNSRVLIQSEANAMRARIATQVNAVIAKWQESIA